MGYVSISKYKDDIPNEKNVPVIAMCFHIEDEKPFIIGQKMNEINSNAYMNGYNWSVFFNYYLSKYEPNILTNLIDDSEAGTYVAIYKQTSENEARANKFLEIIIGLIENEVDIYRIIREDGKNIEWE